MSEVITDYKVDISKITDIIDEVKKPDSLNNLAKKYGLPLTVKCVKEFYSEETNVPKNLLGRVLNYSGCKDEDYEDYWQSDEIDGAVQNGDSKKFVLWETE